ncbi:hypothetical protein E2C01_095634 [Portunus trituberculatus]|uniref:Uncharacterized protein n=1 Tax=Portunus trituberculatus TaxID=210409 RepID=A0A5B7K4I9_PORTR|nr:hypothetical protein [Portunus trituberculatus]
MSPNRDNRLRKSERKRPTILPPFNRRAANISFISVTELLVHFNASLVSHGGTVGRPSRTTYWDDRSVERGRHRQAPDSFNSAKRRREVKVAGLRVLTFDYLIPPALPSSPMQSLTIQQHLTTSDN